MKKKRGRPSKTILDLSEKQREILLSPLLTCRAKAGKLNMSVGWVMKWEKRLKEELRKALETILKARSRK